MSKESAHFWKYHNKDNMDVHTVRLIERQDERIQELRMLVEQWRNKAIGYKYALDNSAKTR